jgi:uncharacterized protein (DUF1778 family)
MPNTVLSRGQKTAVVARVPEDIKRRWQSAATMRGQTLTDFLIVAANNAAEEVYREENRLELSERDQIALAEMLLNPPELAETMKHALKLQLGQIKGA